MKNPIVITLIIMGTLLIMSPMLAEYLTERNLVDILSKPGMTNAHLDGGLSGILYQIGCWLTGSAMIVISVVPVFWRKRNSEG
jgi:hypothetical protein